VISHLPLGGDPSQGLEALQGFAPGAVYSDAVSVALPDATFVFVSGKTGTRDGVVVDGDMAGQTRQAFRNIDATLRRLGSGLADVVRLRVYVTDISAESVRAIHEVRSLLFDPGWYPASTLVKVGGFVRAEALIEIEADAVISWAQR
jgi:enamine deaminase RidA (YjgF/YER057c/UK114 family)